MQKKRGTNDICSSFLLVIYTMFKIDFTFRQGYGNITSDIIEKTIIIIQIQQRCTVLFVVAFFIMSYDFLNTSFSEEIFSRGEKNLIHKRNKIAAFFLVLAIAVSNFVFISSAEEREYEYVIEKVRNETSDYIADMISLMIYGDSVKNPYFVGAPFPSQEAYLTLKDSERGYNVYLASSQCAGFANWTFWKLFGTTSYGTTPTGRTVDITNVGYLSKGTMTVKKLQQVFAKAKAGAHVRVASRVIGKQHSLVFLTTDINNTGFYFLDAKRSGGSYKVFFGFYKFTDFVNKYGAYTLNGIFNPTDYPNYDYTELLTIQDLKYPYIIPKGKSYTMEGFITSQTKISEVEITAKNSSGNKAFTYKTNPNTKIWNIINADNWLSFSKLSVGTYTLEIAAKNAGGEEMTVTRSFTVQSGVTAQSRKETIERYVPPVVTEPETTILETEVENVPHETDPENIEETNETETAAPKKEEKDRFINIFVRLGIPETKPSILDRKYVIFNYFEIKRLIK